MSGIWDRGYLHLGCGEHIIPGWVNLDGIAGPGVDVVMDIHTGLETIPAESFSWIYTSHCLEHLYPDKVPGILQQLHRTLRPGGKLTIATTDLDGIYLHRYRAPDNGPYWECAMFGSTNSTDHPMAAHRDCFTYAKLERLLKAAGFATVRPWRIDEYPLFYNLNDFGRSCALVTCFAEGIK